MKKITRKTQIKCPKCKSTVIGYKHPTDDPLFGCLVKYNENTSRKSVTWNGYRGIFCLECEKGIKGLRSNKSMN